MGFASVAKQFKTDPKREKNGIWHSFENDEGEEAFALLIARAGGANTDWEKAAEKVGRKIGGRKAKRLSGRQLRALQRPLYARHVVIGWRGVRDENGNEIPYSPEAAEELLTEFSDLYDEVVVAANDLALYRVQTLEDDAKN